MTDPIADMLTRIRNGGLAQLPTVSIRHSKLKESIAAILKREGYITDYSVEVKSGKTLQLRLKYEGRKSVITGLARVSRPGIRRYVGANEIPSVLGGLGVSIVSTPRGVVTGSEARKNNVGGELICNVW